MVRTDARALGLQSIALAFENCVFACVCVLRVRDMLGAQTKSLFNSSKNTVYGPELECECVFDIIAWKCGLPTTARSL